jgi:hypothetical protein
VKRRFISFLAPAELVEAIDRMAIAETERTGLPVNRSGIMRRALEEDMKRRSDELAAAKAKRGAA